MSFVVFVTFYYLIAVFLLKDMTIQLQNSGCFLKILLHKLARTFLLQLLSLFLKEKNCRMF